jgi:ABC-type glycerol-3-phosphate transport system permease component
MSKPASRAPRRSRRILGAISRHAMLLGFSALALLPIYFMLVNAFKTRQEYLGNRIAPPQHPVMSSLADAMAGGDLYSWLLNSFLVTALSVGISTALAALAAYPLSLMRWRAGPFVYAALIALLVVPPIVLVVPLFELVVDLRQLNTLHTVIVIYTGITLPFSTFLLASFFATISRPLLEAARIDGAGSWRAFWEIVIPLSVPALMTVVIVQALWVWNEVLIAVVFLQDQGLRTLMVGLTLFNSRYRHDVPVVMAGMLWAAVPMVALYLVGQRFFIRGLTAGGVKG